MLTCSFGSNFNVKTTIFSDSTDPFILSETSLLFPGTLFCATVLQRSFS